MNDTLTLRSGGAAQQTLSREALEHSAQAASLRAMRVGQVRMHAARLGLATLGLEALGRRRYAEAEALRVQVREVWQAAGCCRRCGNSEGMWGTLCRDCADDLAQ